MSKFTIDFFELAFLAESCIPPQPIARTTFWYDLIDKHYHSMLPSERKHLFEWITSVPSFSKENEDCQLFYARFNPDNQYLVYTHVAILDCFRFNDRYHTSRNSSIVESYIIKTEKI